MIANINEFRFIKINDSGFIDNVKIYNGKDNED